MIKGLMKKCLMKKGLMKKCLMKQCLMKKWLPDCTGILSQPPAACRSCPRSAPGVCDLRRFVRTTGCSCMHYYVRTSGQADVSVRIEWSGIGLNTVYSSLFGGRGVPPI